jgi:regulator of replication initiation timing
MIELRNLRKLHSAQKVRIQKLEAQVRFLKQENKELRAENALLKTELTDLRVQMEELRTMVFGKKRQRDEDHDNLTPNTQTPVRRTKDSYKRSLPRETDITKEEHRPIDACTHCQGAFSERDSTVYFEEDIPLPQKKTVTRHTIEKGYCTHCKKWSVGTKLPYARVILGDTVKRYVVYLSVVCRLSYTQIQDVLKQTYDFDISQGEIAKIMEKEGVTLNPAYEQLKERIRGEPSVHLDETSWNLVLGDGYQRYAWTMAGGTSTDTVFLLGKTRGKGNATDLIHDSTAVVNSDDYGAYRTLANPHQLCCAHILRKLRDLAQSGTITGSVHEHCVIAYHTFARIYKDIETARTSPTPESAYDTLLERLYTFAQGHLLDFTKLIRIKGQISERAENYLTCLRYPHVASDNNLAERSLRHIVLKRKVSFGSYSEKTADTLAVLLSVLMSWKRRGMLRDYLMGV